MHIYYKDLLEQQYNKIPTPIMVTLGPSFIFISSFLEQQINENTLHALSVNKQITQKFFSTLLCFKNRKIDFLSSSTFGKNLVNT